MDNYEIIGIFLVELVKFLGQPNWIFFLEYFMQFYFNLEFFIQIN